MIPAGGRHGDRGPGETVVVQPRRNAGLYWGVWPRSSTRSSRSSERQFTAQGGVLQDAPVALSYGKGNGFLPGVGRANQGDNLPVEILYVQGGERNIDYSPSMAARPCCSPKSQELSIKADATRPTKGRDVCHSCGQAPFLL